MQKRVDLVVEDSSPPLWLSNPRFSHMKWENKKTLVGETSTTVSASSPVMIQLKTATSVAQAEVIVCTSFATRLAAILQMSVDSISQSTP
ncbi:hypothetical protein N7494_000086 [Penicillium frequentans]|uniref:Uncharacterized protein n=1 Tax=Penicillium frequentans TaxID=3151616 RepID=A0AAD6GJI1_9EURO|nr:hypothetical protein N7494_000086 [Penicillium glabrum]